MCSSDAMTPLPKHVSDRIQSCEQGLLEKERDIVNCRFQLNETKLRLEKKEEEIEWLKNKNFSIENELNIVKETCKKLHASYERLVTLIEDKGIPVLNDKKRDSTDRNKVESNHPTEAQHLKMKKRSGKKSLLIENCSCKSMELIPTIQKEFKNLEQQWITTNNEILSAKSYVDKLASDVICRINDIEDTTDDILLQDKASADMLDDLSNELDEVRAHINHTNDLLLYEKNVTLGDTVFVWRIRNFRDKVYAGRSMQSSKFYSRPHGHLCQLYSSFDEDKNFQVYFRLACGKNSADVTSFRMNVIFKLFKNDGSKKVFGIKAEDIDAQRDESFTLLKAKSFTLGLGNRRFLKYDDFSNFVRNDALTLSCTVTPNDVYGE